MRRLVIVGFALTTCVAAVLVRAAEQVVSAQASAVETQAASRLAFSDVEQEGLRLFQQNCSVCHIPGPRADRAYGPRLHKDLVGDGSRFRETIVTGRPGTMPGFRYALQPAQVDAIVTYLKTVDSAPRPPEARASMPERPTGSLVVLTGGVKSPSGEKMEGVTVSAKAAGDTITTSVFTDKDGNYYFPAMPGGTYRVWAQAVGFEAARADVNLRGASQRRDFTLRETTDFVRQLSGGEYVAALPLDTPHRRRMRDILVQNCTTCHTAATALQNRYDEAGWDAIITLMTRLGATQGMGPAVPHIQRYKNELAAYLAEMRGPGPSPMQFTIPPRPTGAATLPVVYEYDIPLEEYGGYAWQDGSDWSQGTPSNSYGVRGIHDASIDFDGNIWFTYSVSSKNRTYGRINTRTGDVTDFKVPGRNGNVATTHGIMRGPDGNMWVNVSGSAGAGNTGDGEGAPGSLGRIDVRTGKIDIYTPPKGIGGVGGHVDWDGKGFIWASTRDGAVRFDPRTSEWKEFKSLTKERSGTYGVAADRNGTGWWAEIAIDKLGYSDVATGRSLEFDIPKNTFVSAKDITPEDIQFYETVTFANSANGPPWQQGPRRLAADKQTDDIWVGLFAGSNLMRLNGRTRDHKIYPLPGNFMGAYMPAIDNSHNVWVNVQGDDAVAMFNPRNERWTSYYWPSRGPAPRHLSVLDRDGVVQVVTSFWGTSRAGRMVIRTEKDLQALRSQARAMAAR